MKENLDVKAASGMRHSLCSQVTNSVRGIARRDGTIVQVRMYVGISSHSRQRALGLVGSPRCRSFALIKAEYSVRGELYVPPFIRLYSAD